MILHKLSEMPKSGAKPRYEKGNNMATHRVPRNRFQWTDELKQEAITKVITEKMRVREVALQMQLKPSQIENMLKAHGYSGWKP